MFYYLSLVMLSNALLKSIKLMYKGACLPLDCSNMFLKMYTCSDVPPPQICSLSCTIANKKVNISS